MSDFSEKTFVQQASLDVLERELGWRIANPSEVYWSKDRRSPIYREELWKSIKRLNAQKLKTLGEKQIEEVINTVIKCLEEGTLKEFDIQTNKEKYELIMKGKNIKINTSKGDEIIHLRFLDFENPENNSFVAVAELTIDDWDKKSNCRPDIVGFLNGIPLLFIECKAQGVDLEEKAYEGNYKKYLDRIPQLFAYNAFCALTSGDQSKIGAVGSPYDFFSDWHRLKEEDEANTSVETFLRGVCNKKNFLDLFENFILFGKENGKIKKIIARNHQFLGVNKAFQNYLRRKELGGKLGTFWHTQGSGKSLSIVFFAEKIKRKCDGNQSFLLLTDRIDLEKQLKDTFLSHGCLGSNDDCIARNKKDLISRLKNNNTRYIFSLIHKFRHDKNESSKKYQRISKEIVIIADEAHRTNYGELADEMYDILSNSHRIAFTGTPLKKGEEKTAQKFGEYISIYDFQKALQDKVTVQLYYEDRTTFLKGVENPEINDDFAKALEEEDDKGLIKRHVKIKELLMNKDRLEKIAKDFVSYYSERMELGKAIFVCIDRLMCIVMKNYVWKFWQEEIERLNDSLSPFSEDEKEEVKKKIKRMKKTQMAYVISDGPLKEERLKYYGEISKDQGYGEKIIEERFKDKKDPLEVAFVCQKWLTGFDVKRLSFLFLDRPLRDHSLMQAIARPNRVDKGKDKGLIIDYIKNSTNIVVALKEYSNSDIGLKPVEELIKEVIFSLEWIENFFEENNIPFQELMKEKNIEFRRKILDEIIKKLNLLEEKSQFRKKFMGFRKDYILLDKKHSQEFREKFDAIKEIDKLLSRLSENKNSSGDLPPKCQLMINERVKAEEVNKNFSVDNLYELLKNEENGKKILIRKIEKIKESIFKDIEENYERKMNLDKKINYQREINRLVFDWNSSIQELINIYEELKVQKQIIRKDSNSHEENGLNINENAFFEKIKDSGEIKDMEEQKVKEGCVYVSKEVVNLIYRMHSPFESECTKSAIKEKARIALFENFESQNFAETNTEFFYNYYELLFSRKPEWFIQVINSYRNQPLQASI